MNYLGLGLGLGLCLGLGLGIGLSLGLSLGLRVQKNESSNTKKVVKLMDKTWIEWRIREYNYKIKSSGWINRLACMKMAVALLNSEQERAKSEATIPVESIKKLTRELEEFVWLGDKKNEKEMIDNKGERFKEQQAENLL